jgi:hypothetical protein
MDEEVRYRVRTKGVTWRALDDQIVVLDLESSQYLSVSGAGTEIWPQLLQGATVEELVRSLVDAFDIDEATARTDTRTFLDDLRARNLLR